MYSPKYLLNLCFYALFLSSITTAQTITTAESAEKAMRRATDFMFGKVSTGGGFVWHYTTDLSRRWGEMEAYKSMIWVQGGGTVAVGNTLLIAYRCTQNEYFYQSAQKVAAALIKGQSKNGGWNYMIDFAGENSLKRWYNTIGKNGWRLEEFQHYYGNDTYDDDVTSGAARFLLQMYVQKKDPAYKTALDRAVDFILKSQYPAGGWPQRYPLKYDFSKSGRPDYSSYYTFNDDVIGENIKFLIQCYQALGDKRLLSPIRRGMDFYLLAQQANGAWGQQYNMKMEPAGARSYEPPALLPSTTAGNCRLLMRFYQYTGDRKYLTHIPKAIEWLEKVKLPDSMNAGGRYSHPLYIEPETNKPVFVHRKGSNVKFGFYYSDYNDANLLAHMVGKRFIDIRKLREEYAAVSALSVIEATKNSPLKQEGGKNTQLFTILDEEGPELQANETTVNDIIAQLDMQGRWLTKHVSISNPYVGDGTNSEVTEKYASTLVGDETDTSPYRDLSDTEYISTPLYIRNMRTLAQFVKLAANNASTPK
ncbi:pectate lyase [Paradesertivirga mongoliensis]|uniref:Pectate lyase n=1 Tax=Paradesertivirga mongoliensis TaxID=2100740 RepID=A0ABW4ZR19_9SPHI|nr:pectate lyase [Pedobacter mongoliensis]